jgi:hypothetical protein
MSAPPVRTRRRSLAIARRARLRVGELSRAAAHTTYFLNNLAAIIDEACGCARAIGESGDPMNARAPWWRLLCAVAQADTWLELLCNGEDLP